jgi:hypothetical protein
VRLSAADGDVTNSFQGKLWWNPTTFLSVPEYTAPPPGYTDLIKATTFDLIDNPSYAGRYTVYSPIDAPDAATNPSSDYVSLMTEIHVNEIIGPPDNVGDDLIGSVTNISTFLIKVATTVAPFVEHIVVPPAVQIDNRPITVVGRNGVPWGETFTQNFIDTIQNFAGPSAPSNPYLGMLWLNTTVPAAPTLEMWNGVAWAVLVVAVPGANATYRHTEAVPSATWVITHNLALQPPYVCFHDFFVDIGAGVYKPILPQDVTYDNANQLTVDFSTPYEGVALLRP